MNKAPPSDDQLANPPLIEAATRRPSRPRRPPLGDSGPPPRMGIAHLMMLVAGASINLGLLQILSKSPIGWMGLLAVSLQSILAGAAWTGAAIFVYRKLKRIPWPVESGHLLLAICGFQLAFEAVLEILNHLALRPVVVASNVAAIMTCVLLVLPTFQRDRALAWRVMFVLLTLLFSLPYLLRVVDTWLGDAAANGQLDSWLSRWSPLLSLPVIGAAQYFAGDWKDKTWLHWAGLAVWSAAAVTKSFLAA